VTLAVVLPRTSTATRGALFQFEFKSELDAEMVRFDRLDRVGNVTA
jgi:hypothetical protein